MDRSTAKCYCHDRILYPCPQGYIHTHPLHTTKTWLGLSTPGLPRSNPSPSYNKDMTWFVHTRIRPSIYTHSQGNDVCLLLFYVLAATKVISRWVPTCDSAHSLWLYSGRPGFSHHPDALSWHWANQSLPYPNNAKRLARKWQESIWKSLVWLDQC